MFQIIEFYFSIVARVFGVYNSWEIFPGVTYLSFFLAFIVMSILLSVIFHNVKEEFDHKSTLEIQARRANELSDKRKELRGVKK